MVNKRTMYAEECSNRTNKNKNVGQILGYGNNGARKIPAIPRVPPTPKEKKEKKAPSGKTISTTRKLASTESTNSSPDA